MPTITDDVVNMGLALFKRLQNGTEAVAEELPTPPEVPDSRGDRLRRYIFDQVRQGIIPDEALAEIKRNPTGLRAMMAYGEGALAAGTLLSGGGGKRLPIAGEAHPVLYHGTKADYHGSEVATGKRMYGVHLTSDPKAAETYGNVRAYKVSPESKVLDLSDGETLWDFMGKHEILGKEDLQNVDLERYTKDGQLYQYDISSRTSYADDVARTAQDLGYDIVRMPDNLGSYEEAGNVAHVVVNPKVLKHEAPEIEPPPKYRHGTSVVRGYSPTHMVNT